MNGYHLDPDIYEKERAFRQHPQVDTSESSCVRRRDEMALDAVTKYIKDRKGMDRVVLHPVIGTLYVMIVTQASVEPNIRTEKSKFTWFTVCKKDGVVRTLLEEQGVKNISRPYQGYELARSSGHNIVWRLDADTVNCAC